MRKKVTLPESSAHAPSDSKKSYKDTLRKLQVELVKLQRHFIECNDKILIILEGRDASGKDGTIKRIVQHLSPRETRVVALGKPSDRDRTSWYFQDDQDFVIAFYEVPLQLDQFDLKPAQAVLVVLFRVRGRVRARFLLFDFPAHGYCLTHLRCRKL